MIKPFKRNPFFVATNLKFSVIFALFAMFAFLCQIKLRYSNRFTNKRKSFSLLRKKTAKRRILKK